MDVGIFPLFIAIIIIVGIIQFFRREQAKGEYEQTLSQLEDDPDNLLLRKETLERGREYSKMTRNKYGVASFNESSVMHDIENVTEAPVKTHPQNTLPTVETRLRRLEKLRDENLISREEYDTKRQEILAEV